MCSKKIVPQIVVGISLLIMLSFSAMAQTHLLSEAWKILGKSSSQAVSKTQTAKMPTQTEAVISEQTQPQTSTAATASPLEPNVQLANPPLVLEAEVAEIKSAKLMVNPNEEEWLGIEPPTTFRATAYSLPGRTRAGTHVRRGVIAADPHVLPLGSVVQLKAGNYSGLYTVHDTGSAIKGKRIDVWMPSSREARSFGRQNVRLTVLKYGGGRKQKAKK